MMKAVVAHENTSMAIKDYFMGRENVAIYS